MKSFEELKNTWVWIGNSPKLSELVQKRLFSMGFSWRGGKKVAQYTEKGCVVIYNNGTLAYCNESTLGDTRSASYLIGKKEVKIADIGVAFWVWVGGDRVAKEASRITQERLFGMGYRWKSGNRKLKHDNIVAIEVSMEGEMYFTSRGSKEEVKRGYGSLVELCLPDLILPAAEPEPCKKVKNWRFKTEEEFVRELGEKWRNLTMLAWIKEMDILLGKEIKSLSFSTGSNIVKKIYLTNGDFIDWVKISIDMVTTSPLPSTERWRFKTEAEFVKEFGDEWRHKVQFNWAKEMDELFGKEFTRKEKTDYGRVLIESPSIPSRLSCFNVSEDMITTDPQAKEDEVEEGSLLSHMRGKPEFIVYDTFTGLEIPPPSVRAWVDEQSSRIIDTMESNINKIESLPPTTYLMSKEEAQYRQLQKEKAAREELDRQAAMQTMREFKNNILEDMDIINKYMGYPSMEEIRKEREAKKDSEEVSLIKTTFERPSILTITE